MKKRCSALAWCLLAIECAGLAAVPPAGSHAVRAPRGGSVCMGRAEKRMAKKRAKKGVQQPQPGGRPPVTAAAAPRDVMPRATVEERLREIPCFGILQTGAGGGYLQQDGLAAFWLDNREAEEACRRLGDSRYQVQGVTLDTVYFDPATTLKPSVEARGEANTVSPAQRAFAGAEVSIPLFALDGLQTTDKQSGVASVPLFCSKAECLEFGKQAGLVGQAAEEKLLLADLPVVVHNMINGPAGLLKEAKFFSTAKAAVAMDEQASKARSSIFAGAGVEQDAPKDVFGSLKNVLPW